MALHTAFAAKHGSTILSGLSGLDTQTNPEVDNEVKIGSPYPQFAVLRAQKPRVLFQTHAVAATLGVTGSIGEDIDDTNGFVAFYAKMDGSLPAAGGVHRSYTADRGILIPRRLSCQHQQDAVLDVEALLFSSDGATAPLVISDTATLPTVPRDNVRHTLASVRIGVDEADPPAAIDFGCTIGVEIDFGNNVATRGCNSDVWDKHLEQPGIQPVITLTGLNAAMFAAAKIPLEGRSGTHASIKIILRKRDLSGVLFVGDAEDEHIEIEAEGLIVVTGHTGQGTASAEISVQITCTLDAEGNAPIGIDTAYVISAA